MMSTIKGLIYTIAFMLIILMGSCSQPSRDNDEFMSRVPSEFVEHYKFIDRYRIMYPDKLDSVLQLFDNRYENDSSSIESAYYNLAFAYGDYSDRDYKRALSRLCHAENAITNREFPAFRAEIKLLSGMVYKNLEFNVFAKTNFKEAYNYFKEGDYPNQTMLSALNLAWLASSGSEEGASKIADSYIKQCDSIFINKHDDIEYVNYYHYKYLVDQSNTNYLDSILANIDISVEPSIDISRLYQMNIGLAISLNYKYQFDRARVILNRSDSIFNLNRDKIDPRLRSYHLFEEAITLVEEGYSEAALKIHGEATEIRETVVSDLRIDLSKYSSLYKIYYAIGTKAQIDSAWICHRDASDSLLYRQNKDGSESLFKYKEFAMRRNAQILRVNRYHFYIRVVLIIIGLISLIYIGKNIKINLEIKRKIRRETNMEINREINREISQGLDRETNQYAKEIGIYEEE